MPKFCQLIFLVIVLCYVRVGQSQLDTSQNPQYDFPNLMQNVGTRMSIFQDLKNISTDPDVLYILNEFMKIVPDLDLILTNGSIDLENNTCYQDITYLKNNLLSKDLWGIKMFDASGKLASGFLDGNLKWLGDFHECTTIYVPLNKNGTAGDFNGQYCSVDISLAFLNRVIPLTVGLCIPETCESDIMQLKDVFTLVNPLDSVVNITKLTCQPISKEVSPAAIGVTFLVSVFVLLAVIGSSMTAYEYFSEASAEKSTHQISSKEDGKINGDLERENGDASSNVVLLHNTSETSGLYAKSKPFFSCFCVFTNGEKILNTDGTEGQLLCLHGIRFLSMAWVIVCHTYAFCFASVGNLGETMSIIDSWLFQIILNGFYSVDSFFVLSGFLVAYLFFQEITKLNGRFPWIYFYVHRYIRLTPVYMIALGMNTALFYYMGSGPLWTTNIVEPVCRDNWWYNILYINNFAAAEKICFGWSWYLANDMQFFIISPLFLFTLYKWPQIGYGILGLFLTISFGTNFGITYGYNLFSGLGNISNFNGDINTFMAKFAEFFDKLYIKPYNRISPYLVGIALAYFIFKRKQNKEGKVNWIILCCGWIVSTAVTLTCLFCLYNRQLTTVENSFYNALNRTCFAGGLSWVIFTCLNGQAGPVNSILSFKLFIPLSRLTYCAYLIHPISLTGYFGALKVPLQFSQMTIVTTFLGQLVITYVAAFVFSVLFESPIIRIEKFIRSKITKK